MIRFINAIIGTQPMELLIDGGRIVKIAPDVGAKDVQVFNCKGHTLLPGLIDLHCHLRDPGQEYKEDISSGTRAAARGGYTSVCCMANTVPPNDNAAVTRFILDKAAREGVVRVYPIGAVTKGLKGEEMAEYADLAEAGAVALSDDGKSVPSGMMRTAMRYAKAFGLPIADHSEDKSLSSGGYMNEGEWSTLLGIKGIPPSAEEADIARNCMLSLETGCRLHLCHISTEGSVEIIRHFKSRGAPISCETAPHYIAGTEALCEGYDSHARVFPPLRAEKDRQAIIGGLIDGTIDCIATDHAPHHMDERMIEFSLAPGGISGFETALALCYTYLVRPGHLTLDRLVELMSQTPARLFSLPGGALERGQVADLTLFDPGREWVIDRDKFISKGRNTPFHGFSVTGMVAATFVGGECVYMEKGY